MASRIPKRDDKRRNAGTRKADRIVVGEVVVEQPPLAEGVVGLPREWYLSLAKSAQAMYYEPSDWAVAKVAVEALTDYLMTRKSAALSEFRFLSSLLMVTEGDRRKIRLEIDRVPKGAAVESVSDVAELKYRRMLGLVPPA